MKCKELLEWSDTSKKIKPYLERKGYKYLGAGVDQSAYLEPGTGHVLKIFGTQGNHLSEDHKMFFKWAKYCSKHSNNPYLPKFYGYETFEFKGKLYLQIRQERLVKNSIDDFITDITQTVSSAVEMGDSFEEILQSISYDIDNEKQANLSKKNYSLSGDLARYEQVLNDKGQIKQFKKFYKTCKNLYDLGRENGWHWDLHEANIMRREDGTPVIVDPFVV